MAVIDFFSAGYRHGTTGSILPFTANPASYRELITAAPHIVKKMKAGTYDAAAWDAIQASSGYVTLPPALYRTLKADFERHNFAATSLPADASMEKRKAIQEQIDDVAHQANEALAREIERVYTPIFKDMETHQFPFPQEYPLKTFKAAEKKMLGALWSNKENSLTRAPVWADDLMIAGSRKAVLQYKKPSKSLAEKASHWMWMVDAAIIAAGSGIIFALGAMTPIGWAIGGVMMATTFVDKWQGSESKSGRLFDWCRRQHHGFYNKKSSPLQPNWGSWKPWVALAAIGLVLFSAGAAAWKMFVGALKVVHAVFATILALCATSYSISSLVGGFNKAMKEIDITLWFHKVRKYNTTEQNTVGNTLSAMQETAETVSINADESRELRVRQLETELANVISCRNNLAAIEAESSEDARLSAETPSLLMLKERNSSVSTSPEAVNDPVQSAPVQSAPVSEVHDGRSEEELPRQDNCCCGGDPIESDSDSSQEISQGRPKQSA